MMIIRSYSMNQRTKIPGMQINRPKVTRNIPKVQASATAQLKAAVSPMRKSPVAPPVYRPQSTPLVLQRKSALPQPAKNAQAHRAPAAGPTQRPQPNALQGRLSPQRPPNMHVPAHRPQPTPKVLQAKLKTPAQRSPIGVVPHGPNNRIQMKTSPSRVIQRARELPRHAPDEDDDDIIEIPREQGIVSPPRNRFGVYDRLLFPLGSLRGRTDMTTWSAGREEVSGAHHIFPKAALSWLWDHLSQRQINCLKQLFYLPQNSGAKAVARLGSNLISAQPRVNERVRPEARWDDPHHHRINPPGEEFLDLVRTQGGNLELRSAMYFKLAQFVMRFLYPRYLEDENFVLSDQEAMVIFRMIMFAETYHYSVEENPRAASFHHNAEFWEHGDEGYSKGLVPFQRPLSDRQLLERYHARKRIEGRESDTRRQIAVRFFRWLGSEPRSAHEDMIKCDFAGSKKIVVRYIHGERRGQSVRDDNDRQYIDWHWLKKLKHFAETGDIDEDEMPWFEGLWRR